MSGAATAARYNVESIPSELRAADRWVCFRTSPGRSGKPKKLPLVPGSDRKAEVDNPATFRPFAEALADAERRGLYLGFAFDRAFGHTFIDLDRVMGGGGVLKRHAARIVDALGTYTEVSVSGDSLHVFAGGLPPARFTVPPDLRPVEVYPKEGGRFCLVTGWLRPDLGSMDGRIEERSAVLADLFPPAPDRPHGASANGTGPRGALTDAEQAAIVAAVAPFWCDGRRHHLALYLSGYLAKQGVPRGQALAIVGTLAADADDPGQKIANCHDSYDDHEAGRPVKGWTGLVEDLGIPEADLAPLADVLDGYWRRTRAGDVGTGAVDPKTADPDRPEIDTGDADLERSSARAWDALRRANEPPRLFRFGGLPVRVEGAEDDAAPIAQPLTEDRLGYELARAARWYRQTAKGRIAVPPPLRVVKDLLAAPTYPLPPLLGIVQVPAFAPDGSLETEPGYHAAGRTFYAPAPGFSVPPVPERPTRSDLDAARCLIVDDLLGDFPFVGPAELANAVALFLDRSLRNLIAGPTPLRLVEAPTPGSGKGLLADVLVRPSVGRRINVMPAPDNDEEWRKRITAQLMVAPEVVLIDNITAALDSGSLSAVLTADWWSDRRLGANEMVRVPVRAAWVATANNPTMSTELARRTVRIRLDPKVDRPWQRSGFRHDDLRGWADANRAELVRAALVLGRHWVAEGMPLGSQKLGSFEHWSAVLGGVLGAAGIDGFLGNLETFYEAADLEGAIWRQFVALWAERFGEAEVGVADLFALAQNVEGFDFGQGSERGQKTAFGVALNRQRDRVVGDFRIVNTRTVQRAKRWRLIRARPGDNPFSTFYDGPAGDGKDGDG